jgi:hypothetical protein
MNCPVFTVTNARLLEVRKLRGSLVLVFDRAPTLEPATATNDRGFPVTVFQDLAVIRLDNVVESPPEECSESGSEGC